MAKRRIPEVLISLEQDLLLQRFLDEPEPVHRGRPLDSLARLRDLCMVRLMLNAGLRVAEVVNLKVRDLEPDSGRLMVRQGKGGKDRAVWVSDADVKLVEGYLAARPGAHGSQDHIFLNRFERKLTTRYLQWMLREYGEAAGIAKQLHPHMLRHTFATDLLRATKNLRLVQKALGHSDVKTTVIYTHIVDDELQDAMQNFRGGRE